MANNNNPESDRSNILCFQPPVTKTDDDGCPEPAAADPLAPEGLRLCKAFFAIEDAALRASLIGLMENIAGRATPRRAPAANATEFSSGRRRAHHSAATGDADADCEVRSENPLTTA